MLRLIATPLARLDHAYRDRPFFTGQKARLLGAFTVVMLAGQTLTLSNSTQADGLDINGTPTSTVIFGFWTLDNIQNVQDTQIDDRKLPQQAAANTDVARLRAGKEQSPIR